MAVADIDPSGLAGGNGRSPSKACPLYPAAIGSLERQRLLLHRALEDPVVRAYLLHAEINSELSEVLVDLNLSTGHVSDDEHHLAPIIATMDAETQAHFRHAFTEDHYAELDSFWAAFRVQFLNIRVAEKEGCA